MKLVLLIPLFLVCSSLCVAQDESPFRVLFYNVENLFDTAKDSLKQDDEFLPQSIRAWSYNRYKKKLNNVARVITAVGEWLPPALVGLCEVENDKVLRDLTRYSALKEHGYRYVMTDSPDSRGIDVALLYQRDLFKLLDYQSIGVELKEKDRTTRDILHVSGLIHTRDTLDVFVVHFPSRSSGQKASEPNRIRAARTLRNAVDSLLSVRAYPQIIVMGDFNDYPSNKSISQVLDAQAPADSINSHKLYHLLAGKAQKRGYGTYKYQGDWGLLDHLIVSGNLLNPSAPFYTNEGKSAIAQLPFLLIDDEKYGGKRPHRTYYGMKYEGGYSDHLPVYVDFVFNPQ
ncbi:endonuclease [Bacteroides sp. OttesenSCG-928-D19]|nr:endonuclease [Bacteroides sp. OttesenSCG-928-N06]MDL2305814.1 endonuclease [Bacteroides sp. OttesenSCG-928-D19]